MDAMQRAYKGFSDWVELDPIKGMEMKWKAITHPDPDTAWRAALPGVTQPGNAIRPDVIANYMKATFDPMGSPYSYNEDPDVSKNARTKRLEGRYYGSQPGSSTVTVRTNQPKQTQAQTLQETPQNKIRRIAAQNSSRPAAGTTLLQG